MDVLSAELRKEVNKRSNKELRKRLMVPAVLYGPGREPVNVAVPEKDLTIVVRAHGHTALCTIALAVNGSEPTSQLAIYKELKVNALTRRVEHVDFHAIRSDQKIQIAVPLRTMGIPTGVDLHAGVLLQNTTEVEIQCLPGNVPDHLEVDVSELDVHQSVHLSDIPLGEGIVLVDDPKRVVASVAAATKQTAEEEAAEEAAEAEAATEAEPADPKAAAKTDDKK